MDQDARNGMTVNERLVVSGLLAEFDQAVLSGDADAVIAVLMRAGLGEAQARGTAEAVLARPERYGYAVRGGGT